MSLQNTGTHIITHTMKTGAMSQSADSSTRVLPDSGSRVPFCIKNFTRPGVPTATWQPPLRVLLFSATGTPPTRVATARLGMSLPSRMRVCYFVGESQTIPNQPTDDSERSKSANRIGRRTESIRIREAQQRRCMERRIQDGTERDGERSVRTFTEHYNKEQNRAP